MAQGMIHRLLALFMDAAEGMGLRCECAELERLAVTVHRVMSYQSRQFHTLEHVFGFLGAADHETTLAAAFHDLIYYQVDDGLPPDLGSLLEPYLERDSAGIRLAPPGPSGDPAYGDCLAVFGFRPGQALQPFTGLNEFLSALVMMKVLENLTPRGTRIAIAACIEASIPFRGVDAQGRGVGEALEARLAALGNVDGIAAMIHRAVAFANADVKDFAMADPGLFLSNTWKLLPESNPALRQKGAFLVREYRIALSKMLGFFRSLHPDRIYREYRGVPEPAALARLREAAGRNLECADAYLRAKLVAVALIEAVSEVSGGDAPMALFMGDIPQGGVDVESLVSFLPPVSAPPWIRADDAVYRLLKDGRLAESPFDLRNSPLTLHLHNRLPPEAWEARLEASEAYFAGRLSAEGMILGFDPAVRADFFRACGHMIPTRRAVLEAWLKAHSA